MPSRTAAASAAVSHAILARVPTAWLPVTEVKDVAREGSGLSPAASASRWAYLVRRGFVEARPARGTEPEGMVWRTRKRVPREG